MDTYILIVDDNPEISESMQSFLETMGYLSKTAHSGEEALDLLTKNRFHVVITDIQLPGMSGFDLTRVVKKQYDIDIIVMTSFSKDYSYEEAIGKGASDFVIKPVRLEELLLRTKRVLRERELSNDRNNMLEKLQKLAITDGLTKFYNSRYFYNQLEVETDRANRYDHPLSLLLIDIDHFKRYNDAHGHLEGDKVLVRFSRLVKSCLRVMDSAYRYGGEEFTILLPETTGKEALTVAERIRKLTETEKMIPKGKHPVTVTISIGVTEYLKKEKLTKFIQRADKAMYLSKQNGRNRVSFIAGKSC